MCVDWTKALVSLWRVDPRTQCDLITTALISSCSSTYNCIVKIITETAICNPMSCSGDNYRELLDGQCTLNLEPCF